MQTQEYNESIPHENNSIIIHQHRRTTSLQQCQSVTYALWMIMYFFFFFCWELGCIAKLEETEIEEDRNKTVLKCDITIQPNGYFRGRGRNETKVENWGVLLSLKKTKNEENRDMAVWFIAMTYTIFLPLDGTSILLCKMKAQGLFRVCKWRATFFH